MASAKQIEEYLQKIRRLPSNKLCANCRTPSRLGFSAVCVKYQSFVCDLCKSAHQSFSHRTKSVTMSTWTMEEVKALDEKNGGGNDWCRARWFARMSESEAQRHTPKEGDPLDNYKKFVHMVYEQAKYYDESGKPASTTTSSSSVSTSGVAASSSAAASKPVRTNPAARKPAVATAAAATKTVAATKAEEDLLILDFDAKVTVSSTTSTTTAKPVDLMDEWGAFTTTTSAPSQVTSKPGSSLSDDWTFQSATAATTLPPPQTTSAPAQPNNNPLIMNVQSLYQPQSPSAASVAFPPTTGNTMMPAMQPYGAAFAGNSGFAPMPPATNNGNGMGMMMTMNSMPPQKMVPPMGGMPLAPMPMSNDPFVGLQSFNSAPSVMLRTNSTTNGNAAPSMGGGLARAVSAPANDPFAGLI